MFLTIDGHAPELAAHVWVAPTAVVIGDVHLGEDSSVWYTTVVRADRERITIGRGSNLQDGVIVHADPGFPVEVGADVTVGHRAVLHGCRIGVGTLVGMGATVLNGAVIGAECIIGAGAVVSQGAQIPDRSLVLGVPAVVKRTLTAQQAHAGRDGAAKYRGFARAHADALALA